MATSTTRANNAIRIEDRAAHDWYRFVLSFPPHLVRHYLEKFGIGSNDCVLDPFCGTGTTLVECKKRGIRSIGVESNPMANFASQVKVNWRIDPGGLLRASQQVAKTATKALEADGIEDFGRLPLFRRSKRDLPMIKTLSAEAYKLLLKNSISPLPLHKTLVLLEAIESQSSHDYESHQKLSLAKALVDEISNLHFGPEVGIGPPKSDAPVISTWLSQVQAMANDLRSLQPRSQAEASVYRADARELGSLFRENSVDCVITSPPYPNEKDYTRTTRLESVILGFIRNKQDLRLLKASLIRSNTRTVYKGDKDDLHVRGNEKIQRIAEAIEARRTKLGKNSGFERLYSRVTQLYFGGMARHLENLRAALCPGAQLAYVVGDQASYLRVMIRTGQLLAEIAESLGYKVVDIELFRKRWATASRAELREEVVILRWPGTT
ncbi:MAG: DNA methyltransferase, partial [Candidatus Acidiferrales bacterium]